MYTELKSADATHKVVPPLASAAAVSLATLYMVGRLSKIVFEEPRAQLVACAIELATLFAIVFCIIAFAATENGRTAHSISIVTWVFNGLLVLGQSFLVLMFWRRV
jgi:hypothetical protein